MNIQLSKEDIEFLVLLLEREYRSALVEQRHTAHYDYLQIVKDKEKEIEDLLAKLKKSA
jgi:hypothetical protein